MDALTHAVEAIHSKRRQPISDGLALHAIKLIFTYLPRCVEQGDDIDARGQQLTASCLAGIAFGNAPVGVVHATAHVIGAKYNVPHGIANSILLPHGMKYNLDKCPERYALVAQAIGIDTSNLDDTSAGEAAIQNIFGLTKKINLPQKLRDVGVSEEGLEKCAGESLLDMSIFTNPKRISDPNEVLKILREAW